MKLSQRTVASGLIIILCLLITYWFSSNFRIVWEREYVGYQGEAAYNSLLAAQRLLERLDLATETVYFLPNFEHKLRTVDTIILLPNDTTFNPLQSEHLLTWVRGGGHLILESNQLWDDSADNGLLTPFTVERKTSQIAEKWTTTPLKFKWRGQILQVIFNLEYQFSTKRKPLKFVKSAYGHHLLHYRHGDGLITLLSDLDFIANAQIGKYDHAQFFWQLIQLKKSTRFVWLADIRGHSTSSLWRLLWEYAWTLLISIAVLSMIWLWNSSRRFGSLLPAPPRTRRRLLEHIEASGRFLWQQQQIDILLQETRQVILKRLAQIHPNWLQLSRDELVAHLAQLCRFSAEEVHTALYRPDIRNEAYFTRAIQVLIAIQSAINNYAK